MMAALLRHGAARRLGGSIIQRAQTGSCRGSYTPRRSISEPKFYLASWLPRIAEGKKSLKDDQAASPTRDGYDWRQFPYTDALATLCNGALKGALFITVVSTFDFYWLFGIDRPEEKKRRVA